MSNRKTILVVDDVPDNIRLIIDLLKDTYTVLVATSGSKALDVLAKNNTVDLLLLDIMMPEMNGIELFQKIQENPLWASIPAIFLTADTRGDTLWQGFGLGAKDYILKPIVPEILQARIQEHFVQ